MASDEGTSPKPKRKPRRETSTDTPNDSKDEFAQQKLVTVNFPVKMLEAIDEYAEEATLEQWRRINRKDAVCSLVQYALQQFQRKVLDAADDKK
jgi:hypothetical protein